MKKLMITLSCTGLLVFSTLASAKKYHEYKCYALLENDTYAVIDVTIKQPSLAQASKAAIADGHKFPDQKVQRVAQIMQCTERNESFSDANAQKLDEQKLR